MVPDSIIQENELGLLKEMADSRYGVGNVQDELEYLVMLESKKVLMHTHTYAHAVMTICQGDTGAN